ncbi:MAG: hypothetical protein HXX10_17615 [Rhodoplanes sp.]|uniref:hypothetical protein n=1 Tax=Rhodoplanes sp. TaxID=1968906 RepID=UPI0017E10423|nr:hypothetical protein [Rhodoplanes sp.]NVO15855.1 hypothetical protein [Rhodoplanes sp.]
MTDEQLEAAKGYIRPRPIRVAFFVADGDHSHLKLDGIFAESMSRWGGRYSLICPCENGYPCDSYIPWLTAFDPDIIYSFVDLSDEGLLKIRESFGPAYLVRHAEDIKGEPTARDFRVALPISTLTSLSTTLQYARAFPASAPQPIRLVDYLPASERDHFIDDNFGTFYGSYGRWPIPPNLADAVKPLAVVSDQVLNKPNRGRRYADETVGDATALLHYLATHPNTFGLAQVAADAAPRIELRDRYENAFMLVVGESFADRVVFWNLRSRDPAFLGREPTTLIVAPARLEDPEFFTALVAFLKRRNGVPRDSGTPWVELCSTSVPEGELTAIGERFRAADNWNSYHVTKPITLDSITPSAKALERPLHLITGGFFERGVQWKEFPATGQQVRPPMVEPSHIEHVQSKNFAVDGSWAMDVRFERQENHSRFSNIRHQWHFPRRLRFHQAFLGYHEAKDQGREYRHTRTTGEGTLTLFAGLGEQPPVIALPNDETAFRYAMQRGDTWPPFRRFDKWEAPTGPFEWAQPSDKGRYLIGALRMFGGIQEAGAVLLHSYWRAVFDELGGSIGPIRREQVRDKIKKKVRAVRTPPGDWNDDTWDRLTALVASEAHQMRLPQQALSYDMLLKRHDRFLATEQEILAKKKADKPEKWIARAKRSLRNGVQNRCAQKVLFQGYQWRCDTCFNTNWNDIGALEPELVCSICGAREPAPVDRPWSFKLNGFLKDALREHGLTALVWCLITLEGNARETFFYLGPHELWKSYPKDEKTPPEHEADLICVVDGIVHLCEVKSSGRDIGLTSLVEVAMRLRPDVVTLAVMEPPSKRLNATLEELKRMLNGSGIGATLLTLRPDDRENDAYLP